MNRKSSNRKLEPARRPNIESAVLLCIITGLRSIADRSWGFILPIFLAEADPGSLAPTAVLGAVQTITTIVLSARLGKYFETGDRQLTFKRVMIVENLAVLLGGSAVLGATVVGGKLLFSPLYWIGLAFLGCDAVCSSTLEVVVIKDWAATICSTHGGKHSSSMDGNTNHGLIMLNSWITGTDLGTSILSYLLLGYIMSGGMVSPKTVLTMLCGWHLFVGFLMSRLVDRLCTIEPELRTPCQKDLKTFKGKNTKNTKGTTWLGFEAFRRLPPQAKFMMIGYICLYLTVLSPSGVLTAWLVTSDVPTDSIATFRAFSQFAGVAGTVIAPILIASVGAIYAALVTITLQLVCVWIAVIAVTGIGNIDVSSYFYGNSGRDGKAMLVMMAVALSRFGLWGFDLSERQAVQQVVQHTDRVLLFSWERAMCNIFSFTAVGLSTLFSDPADFYVPVTISALCITAAFLATVGAVVAGSGL